MAVLVYFRDPTLDSLHGDPRWESLLLKVGLLDTWRELQTKRSEAG